MSSKACLHSQAYSFMGRLSSEWLHKKLIYQKSYATNVLRASMVNLTPLAVVHWKLSHYAYTLTIPREFLGDLSNVKVKFWLSTFACVINLPVNKVSVRMLDMIKTISPTKECWPCFIIYSVRILMDTWANDEKVKTCVHVPLMGILDMNQYEAT